MKKTNNTTDLEAALDLLAMQVREEILRIRNEGADAMKHGDYDTAKSVIDFAGKLELFAGDVDGLVEQWNKIAKQHDVEPETVKAIVGKTFFQRVVKGSITTNKDFYIPLLIALEELGGGGKTQDVIDQVGKVMQGKLKPNDYELLKSEPHTIRWRNKVMWARNSLVNELGYMRSDSPFGVWTISDKGRKWLENQKNIKL
jgi:restriction system protein